MRDLLSLLTVPGSRVRIDAGRDVVSMGALADGGTAQGSVTNKSWPTPPTFVIGSLDQGGTIFFSAQYLIGCYGATTKGFTVNIGSSGGAFSAGWTIMVNWIAVWLGEP